MKAKKKKTNKSGRWPFWLMLSIALAVVVLNTRSCFNNRHSQSDSTAGIEFNKEGELTFWAGLDSSAIISIDIELAEDDYERAMGLMHRYTMEEGQGMLFIMNHEEPQSFWMKNTHISLDILYVNSQLEIVKIHKFTQPFSQQGIPSVKPAKYVVEVVAGFCNKHHIIEGDRISFERITTDK